MSVKILGGILKGFSLSIENEDKTRPTSVLLKRKMFDFRQDWSEYNFCDLCAGTGSVGLEAWSRGAGQLLCIDSDFKTVRNLSKNFDVIKEKHLQEYQERKLFSVKADVAQFLGNLEKYDKEFSFSSRPWVLFFDPPYENSLAYKTLCDSLLKQSYFCEVWIECDKLKGSTKDSWPLSLGLYNRSREYEHGDHYIIQYVRN